MAYAPGDIKWCAVGTPDRPKGVPVPLTDALRRGVADALNGATPGPTATPVPIPTPTPLPTPTPAGLPPRKPAGRQEWGKPSDGGEFADWDVVGTPADAAADRHGIRVTAPKQNITLRNLRLSGWSNGLTVEHTPENFAARLKNWRLEYCLFADNRGDGRQEFRGQGAYLAAADDWVFYRCCFVGNGRPGSGFNKGCYVQGGLTEWHMPEGCRRVRYEECTFAGNAAEGLCGKGDGTQVVNCLFTGNAWGCMVNGPLPSLVAGNVVVAGPHAVTWYDPGQHAGAGGIQWRAASGTLSDNLCVLPPECRMPDKNWRAPAFEATPDKGGRPAFRGTIAAAGGNNVAVGYDEDYAAKGPVPGFRLAKDCPPADWLGFMADAERQARNGTASAASLIAAARRMAGAA